MKWSKCIFEHDILRILHMIHNEHEHYIIEVTQKRIVGTYYWPDRLNNIREYCQMCKIYQSFGPLQPTQITLPILTLQPLNLIRIDYIDPITPISKSDKQYIYIIIDYYSRYVFAKTTLTSIAAIFINAIIITLIDHFRWPRCIYCDNRKLFWGEFFETLKENGVKQIYAPVYHPSSIGLVEQLVQLVIVSLWKKVQEEVKNIQIWDDFLPNIVHAIQIKISKIHKYTSAELFFRFNPQCDLVDNLENKIRIDQISDTLDNLNITFLEEAANYDVRVAWIEEIRSIATRKRVEEHKVIKEVKRELRCKD